MIDYHKTVWIKSSMAVKQFPPDQGKEVAFIGRSNIGKSSALNVLIGKKLARTSQTPGRTQQIHFFEIEKGYRLVDLPGYGYAKVPISLRDRWRRLIDNYLRERESLVGLVLLMDCRNPVKPFEIEMLKWCASIDQPVYVLLTKADKLSRSQQHQVLQIVQSQVKSIHLHAEVALFSARKFMGLLELKKKLSEWFLDVLPHHKNTEYENSE